jgi:hypothetical protein
MRCRYLLPCFSALVFGCGGGVTSPKNVLIYMAIDGNTSNGAYAIGIASTINAAMSTANAGCGAFCNLIGTCQYSNVVSTSDTWGAIASSGSVVYLGQRQYLFASGCGRSPTEASSAAVAACSEPGYPCTALRVVALTP